jgi:hypothetical protein
MKQHDVETGILIIKVLIFLYIVISPVVNHRCLDFMDNIFIKTILLLFIVVCAIYGEMQLAILIALAVFILVINFNKLTIQKAKNEIQRNINLKPDVALRAKNNNYVSGELPEHVSRSPKNSHVSGELPEHVSRSPKNSHVYDECVDQRAKQPISNIFVYDDLPQIPQIPQIEHRITSKPLLGGNIKPHFDDEISSHVSDQVIDGRDVLDLYDPDPICKQQIFDEKEISEDMLEYYLDEKTKPFAIYIRMLTNVGNLKNIQSNSV